MDAIAIYNLLACLLERGVIGILHLWVEVASLNVHQVDQVLHYELEDLGTGFDDVLVLHGFREVSFHDRAILHEHLLMELRGLQQELVHVTQVEGD